MVNLAMLLIVQIRETSRKSLIFGRMIQSFNRSSTLFPECRHAMEEDDDYLWFLMYYWVRHGEFLLALH